MKRVAIPGKPILAFLFAIYSLSSFSQDVTGIWKGYFVSNDGQQYRLEFQVKQNAKGQVAVTGVSYSWQDDIKFYGKATMTGSFVRNSKNFRIKEIKTVEVKSATGFGTCIMNYDLAYSKMGKEEFLEGTYLGKQEVKGRVNPYEWGDCGGGKVFLRRVTTSDFYIEPFLRRRTTVSAPPKDTVVKRINPPIVKKDPVVPPKKKPDTRTTTTRPITRTEVPIKKDTIVKINPPVTKVTTRPVINVPAVLKERANELMKSLIVHDEDVVVKLYDNGEIDDDTISIYYDKKLLLSSKRLSGSPITVRLKIEDDEVHELVMVAENLGRIPPNTSLMIVDAGEQRFDVRITSTEQKNALVRFKYEKSK